MSLRAPALNITEHLAVSTGAAVAMDGQLDPARLKQTGGRPAKYDPEAVLALLTQKRLRASEWSRLAKDELGVSNGSFFAIAHQLEETGKVHKSAVDDKYEQLQNHSKTSLPYNDQ